MKNSKYLKKKVKVDRQEKVTRVKYVKLIRFNEGENEEPKQRYVVKNRNGEKKRKFN